MKDGKLANTNRFIFYSFFGYDFKDMLRADVWRWAAQIKWKKHLSSLAAGTGKWVSGLRTHILWHDKVNINNKYCWVENHLIFIYSIENFIFLFMLSITIIILWIFFKFSRRFLSLSRSFIILLDQQLFFLAYKWDVNETLKLFDNEFTMNSIIFVSSIVLKAVTLFCVNNLYEEKWVWWRTFGFEFIALVNIFHLVLSRGAIPQLLWLGAAYLHVCSSMIRVHVSHFTWQHQWNLQLHRSFTIIFFVLYPRPQHKIAQPSKPDDDLLQTRLCVPVNKWENEYTHAQNHSTTALGYYFFSTVCIPGHCNCFVFRHQSGLSSK